MGREVVRVRIVNGGGAGMNKATLRKELRWIRVIARLTVTVTKRTLRGEE